MDAFLISGDLMDGTPDARGRGALVLDDLRTRGGVFAVPGNHDYFGDFEEWLQSLRQLELDVLLNERRVIRRSDACLVLAGVTDPAASARQQPGPDVLQALLDRPDKAPVILMSHRPAGALKNAATGVNVQLSGHTHGGQVRGLDRLVARVNRGFVSGRYQVGAMQLIVRNGTGQWAGIPMRLGRPAEIIVITLQARQQCHGSS